MASTSWILHGPYGKEFNSFLDGIICSSSPEGTPPASSRVRRNWNHHVATHHHWSSVPPPPPSPPTPPPSIRRGNAWAVGSLRAHLETHTHTHIGTVCQTQHDIKCGAPTLICLPLNRDSFSLTASSTISFSANSTYANLHMEY